MKARQWHDEIRAYRHAMSIDPIPYVPLTPLLLSKLPSPCPPSPSSGRELHRQPDGPERRVQLLQVYVRPQAEQQGLVAALVQ